MGQDHYATLGIPRDASPTQVTLAFFERVREQDHDSDTHELYKAYEVLSNLDRRRVYDAELAAAPQDAPAPPPPGHPGTWPKQPSGAPVQPGRAPSRRSASPTPAAAAGTSVPYGATGSPYLVPSGPTTAHKTTRAGLQRPRGWALVALALLAGHFTLVVVSVLYFVLGVDVDTEPSELVAMLVMVFGFAALMAWGGLRQILSRKRENGYLACVALPTLLLLGATASAGASAAVFMLVGLGFYVATVELWRRQQQRR